MVEVREGFKIPIYGGTMIVVVCDSKDVYKCAKRNFKVKDKDLKNFGAVLLGKTPDSSRIYPLLFSNNPTPGMVAHEAMHLVNALFRDIGILADRKNDEAETYLLSWIVNRIWDVRIKHEKKK